MELSQRSRYASYVDGVESVAIVRLFVDGVPVASVQSDAFTGVYSISYLVPESTTSGPHMVEVRFTGGWDWVNPVELAILSIQILLTE